MSLAELFADLAGLPDDASAVEERLRQIARRVADLVDGVDYASITRGGKAESTTVAMSSEVALEVDSAQYDANARPCLQALDGSPVLVEDIAADTRWPDFQQTALSMGLHNSLSLPLFTASGATISVLNMYSHNAGALLPLAMEVIPLYHPELERPRTRNWEMLLGDGARLLVIGVQEALHVRDRIQVAIGILMMTNGSDYRQAYFALRAEAASAGESIPAMADRLIASRSSG